jgi:tetratricopeptide (TPR) repeat protein
MFDRRIQCDPRSVAAYMNGAMSYMAVKNYPRARQLLSTLREKLPDYLLGRLWMGRYFTAVDSLEEAKAEYDEVLRLASAKPDNYRRELGETHFMLGQYYFRKQSFPASAESFRKANQNGYEDAGLHVAWGQAILQTLNPNDVQADNKRKIDDAIGHFRRAIVLETSNEQAHLWLGQGLVMARVEGDDAGNAKLQSEACDEFRKALKINPRNEDAKKAMARIGCK